PKAAPSQLSEKLGPEGLGLGGTDRHAQYLAPAVTVDGDGDDDSDRDNTTVGTDLHISRIQPEIGTVALQRAIEEGRDLVIDLAAHPADLAFRDAGHPHRLDQLVDRAGRDALDVCLLDHRRQRLLGHAPRLQKAREVAALAQLGDAQLDRPGAGLPNPVAIAIAVIDALGAAFAMRGTGQAFDFQLHQALRGKLHHLAQQIGVRTLLQQRAKAHHLVGHRWVLGSREGLATKPYRRSAMTPAVDKWRAAARLAPVAAAPTYPQFLHHAEGHDRDTLSNRPLTNIDEPSCGCIPAIRRSPIEEPT